MVNFLLESDADKSVKDVSGMSALHFGKLKNF
jgi:hypothetical protein